MREETTRSFRFSWRSRTPISSDDTSRCGKPVAPKAVRIGLCLFWILILCATASGAGAVASPLEMAYKVTFQGVEEGSMKKDLEALSDTITLETRPPASLTGLRERTKSDVPRFLEYFESLGHYGATVRVEIDRKSTPIRVLFNIDVGPVYRLESAELSIPEKNREIRRRLSSMEELGLDAGTPVTGNIILNARKALMRETRNMGYAFARTGTPKVFVDHRSRTAKVVLGARTGPVVPVWRHGGFRSACGERIRCKEQDSWKKRRVSKAAVEDPDDPDGDRTCSLLWKWRMPTGFRHPAFFPFKSR